MIDIHCHILNGIDDGAKSITDSIEMAKSAEEEGIHHIVATPHHNVRHWQNPKLNMLPMIDILNEELTKANINVTVSAGQEVRISGDLIDLIDNDDILFLDKTNNYLLIEFPTSSVPRYVEHIFNQLYEREITPVIAHPERNHEIFENPKILYDLINGGALAQLTTSSYTGDLGRKIEKFSKQLIEADLVQLIASDAHNVSNRPFNMDKALKKLEKEYDSSVRELFEERSHKIVNGEYIYDYSPEKIQKKRFFGMF